MFTNSLYIRIVINKVKATHLKLYKKKIKATR